MAKKSSSQTPKAGKDHWEMRYNPSPRGESTRQSPRNWDAMQSKERPCTQNKINELDH